MTETEARNAIAERIVVTRADIVAAKAYLLTLGHGLISIKPQSIEWAGAVSPGTLKELPLYADDLEDQLVRIARHIAARLALCAAAWELVRMGIAFQVGAAQTDDTGWAWTTTGPGRGGHRGGFSWENRFPLLYPEGIWRPAWHGVQSKLFDADLYLQRLQPAQLHVGIEQALRMSLACFRQELLVPCLAMLGAASEGAWIEMGMALAKHFPGDSEAGRLLQTLDDSYASTRAKVTKTCAYYERPACKPLHTASMIQPTRLREIERWSDHVRESRNVLHWTATPTVPNSYEKVAVLLMSAVSTLADLHQIRQECHQRDRRPE
jgi:hypothetical protein